MIRLGTVAALVLLMAAGLSGCIGGVEVAPEPPGDVLPLEHIVDQVTEHIIVDAERWSGEPSILAMDDGTLLITGVSGLTRYAEDPSDVPERFGQSYLWRSVDDGATWSFVDLEAVPDAAADLAFYRNGIMGVEGDLAQDEAGRAYFVDLTALAGNGISSSTDSGASWTATQNPLVGLPGSDRPWVAALGDGEVYVKYLATSGGFRVARSTDAGLTFLEDVRLPSCSQADLAVDLALQQVLLPCASGESLFLLRTDAGPMDWQRVDMFEAAGNVRGSYPIVGVAGPGEYIVTWTEHVGAGYRAMATASFDAGATWLEPVQLSGYNQTAIFSWADANADGQAAVVWYEADDWDDPNLLDAAWTVQHASMHLDSETQTMSAATVIQLSEAPIHEGSICSSGLTCVTSGRAEDRRLLDFFEIDVAPDGRSHVTWTSTRTDVPTVWYGQVSADRAATASGTQ